MNSEILQQQGRVTSYEKVKMIEKGIGSFIKEN